MCLLVVYLRLLDIESNYDFYEVGIPCPLYKISLQVFVQFRVRDDRSGSC